MQLRTKTEVTISWEWSENKDALDLIKQYKEAGFVQIHFFPPQPPSTQDSEGLREEEMVIKTGYIHLVKAE